MSDKMTTTKRTPGPWRKRLTNDQLKWEIIDEFGAIAAVSGLHHDADRIVTACNAHDELVEALRAMRSAVFKEEIRAAEQMADAALARAEGE